MTASGSTATSPPPADTGARATPGPRERLRRLRFPLAMGAVVLAVAALAALVAPGTGGGDLDPRSGAPDGTRAVVRILERQGVQVARVRDPAAAARETGTVVLVHAELLSPSQLSGLATAARRLVLVEPDGTTLDALAPGIRPAGSVAAQVVPPRCSLPEAQAGPARAGGRLYTGTTSGRDQVCYPAGDEPGRGSLVVTTTERGGRTVAVLGQGGVLTNAHLDEDANAALAVRLLGTTPSLTWVVPDPLQAAPDGDPSLGALLPSWVPWVTVQAGLALLLALLWRARRLGPVVSEPLPVAVRSAETLLGRARLYRRARAADRAAATLRTAALRRLAARLAVPATAGPEAVAVRVAQAAGQDPGRVRQVLLGPPPADERALVRLADELDTLEHAVQAGPAGPGGRDPHDQQQHQQQPREGHG